MGQPMRWLTNMRFTDGIAHDPCRIMGETLEQARERVDNWLADKVIGRPKASGGHTIEQHEAMGLRGVYTTDPESER